LANVTVGTDVMVGYPAHFELYEGARYSLKNSTGFKATDSAGHSVTAIGVNLTYNGDGVNGGTVTGLTLEFNGKLIFHATGLAIDGASNVYDTGFAGIAPGIEAEVAYWLRGADTITGGTGWEVLKGFGGNDTFFGGPGNDVIEGGDGLDTAVYSGTFSDKNYAINPVWTPNGTKLVVRDFTGTDGTDSLYGIERLQFGNSVIAFDVDGTGGEAYRLYQAAFDRKPDAGGLGFYIAQLDKGVTLVEAARSFIDSPEFIALYGANTSNDSFMSAIYQNVLHRVPDAGGMKFYVDVLNNNQASRAQVLADISESTENKAQVIGVIQNGFEFTPYGG
jgi:Ca2+-binding RTX toxin-like protein